MTSETGAGWLQISDRLSELDQSFHSAHGSAGLGSITCGNVVKDCFVCSSLSSFHQWFPTWFLLVPVDSQMAYKVIRVNVVP